VLITARQAGDFVEIDVCDKGQGFSEHEQEIIFDLFVRGDATLSQSTSLASKPAGSGLGLAICRSIVEAHGGTIQVAKTSNAEKQPGEHGACIRFTLPAGTPPELEAEIQ
jgi:two-component system, OmpR family, sensor histidine kinase KdpD